MRTEQMVRTTKETNITLSINMDGNGTSSIQTGIGFFDHMLHAFALHSGMEMQLAVSGDLEVDCHHTIEDTGIVIGKVLGKILEDKTSLVRYGSFYVPMDEALAFCALDISGRGFLVFHAEFKNPAVGGMDCCMVEEFFRAVALQAGITLHINLMYGSNDHHKIEAIFKAVANALRLAAGRRENGAILSTKGVL